MRITVRQLLMFCAPLLVASPSFAQRLPEGITLMQGIWTVVFVMPTVSEEERAGTGVARLMDLGLEEATAVALFQHVQSSIEAWKQAGATARANFCANRQQIVTKQDYLREVEKRRKASTDARTRAIEQIPEIVDNVAYAKIVDESRLRLSNLSGGDDVDLATRLAAEPEDAVAKRIAHACGPTPY